MATLQIPDGDDLSELVATCDAGQLREARFAVFMGEANEIEKLSATFSSAAIERLRWKISESAGIFSLGDLTTSSRTRVTARSCCGSTCSSVWWVRGSSSSAGSIRGARPRAP